ncbi:MAG TPA: flippase activity-associated protein Agl23 [Dehalococcoidia bacterium]|nr:flippase activity-associated protein Agl23 [Dehalococcoidia bacterium]
MAEATIGRKVFEGAQFEAALEWVLARKELLAVASIVLVAAVIRFADLGAMALHHDESLHARYTWQLYDGQGYQHNPLMHGPFLFHSGALAYFLFGDADATSRFLPALFGTMLVGMPYLLRKQIGMPAVLIAAAILCFSPTLLYFSRFYRNEMYLSVWSFAVIICIWRYIDEQRDRYLYILAAALALAFATKEVTFILVAIIMLFLNFMFAVELGKRRDDEEISTGMVALRTLVIAPIAWLIAAFWYVLPAKWLGKERMSPVGDLLVLIGLLSLPQFSAAIQVLPFIENHGYDAREEDTLRKVTVIALLLLSGYVGLLWRPKVFAIAAACFFVPFVLLYTTFFTNMEGFYSGIWGSLDYWLDQHHEKRGNQPFYYYGLMTPLYEFLPMLLTFAGVAWVVLRGDAFRRWLGFWLLGIFLGLSIAGEKMPWLETYIVLPMALIGAIALARVIEALGLKGRRWLEAAGAAAASVLAVILLVEGDGILQWAGVAVFAGLAVWLVASLLRDPPKALLSGLPDALASIELHATVLVVSAVAVTLAVLSVAGVVEQFAAVWVAAILPIALVGYVIGHVLRSSPAFGRGTVVVAVAVLLTLTVRASLTASFENKDTPVEMLVYTQTSPDIPEIMDRIQAVARESGLGTNLPIVIDDTDSYAWPWAWYLRDYHEVSYARVNENYEPPPNAVLLIHRSNASFIDGGQYNATPYKHRWWFCETYRDPEGTCRTDGALTPREGADIVTDIDRLQSLGRFFLYRRPAANHTGSVDAVAYFPLTLSAFDGPQAAPREPVTLADGRIILGSPNGDPSNTRGDFRQPGDLFVDAAGNIWVADSLNNRIQKFDSRGVFLDALSNSGAPGGLDEPWSVAVDAEGFVYVADTWHHRIQKYDSDLNFVAAWGQPKSNDNPGPLDFFGPRDIAIAADGTVWVTDTGNNRLLHFTKDGRPLEGSGTAAFREPVGLTFDASGNLLVADTWSGRVLRFGPGMTPGTPFASHWTSTAVPDKPYIAVLKDGRILVSVPERGRLYLFDASGRELGSWQPLPSSRPIGVAATADGGFAFTDGAMHQVQVVPLGAMANLFK